MNPEKSLQHLEELLIRLGVEVRSEPFDTKTFSSSFRGGLCRLKKRLVVLVDSRAPLVDRIAVHAAAAARLDSEAFYVPPAVRILIDAQHPRNNPSREGIKFHLRLVPSIDEKD